MYGPLKAVIMACRAEMEQQQQDVKRDNVAVKRGRVQHDLDERFGDAFGVDRKGICSGKYARIL
jgi:hypothetical protein